MHGDGMTVERQALGRLGEELAARELERRGYAILARRYRTRHGEIDIVADDRGTLVFVEVKARAGDAFGTGGDAVTPSKRRQLVRMATEYLMRMRVSGRPCRFDVVSVACGRTPPALDVYQHAFDAG